MVAVLSMVRSKPRAVSISRGRRRIAVGSYEAGVAVERAHSFTVFTVRIEGHFWSEINFYAYADCSL